MRKLFVAFLLAFLLSAVCENEAAAQLGRLHFKGYKITKITPTSFRSVKGTAEFDIVNDSLAFTMSNIKGTVYKKGVAFVSGSADPVSIISGRSTVRVDGQATLCEGITLWNVLQCVFFRAEDYTIDVSMSVVNAKGVRREYAKHGMSVASLLHNVRSR